MKHLKVFETAALFEAARATLDLPNVSLVEENFGIQFIPYIEQHDYSQDYLTLSILEDGEISIGHAWNIGSESAESEFWMYEYVGGQNVLSAGYGLQYSLDNGETWNNFEDYFTEEYNWNYNEATDEQYSETGYEFVSVHAGDKMLLKALHVNWRIGDSAAPTKIVSTCNFNAEGNIMSIVWGDNFIGKTDFLNEYDLPRPNTMDADIRGNWAFNSLFQNNTHIINAENLILPALQLCEAGYGYMFDGCTNLLTAPVLPATTLANGCYEGMFSNCTSLTTAPVLPATTLKEYCYLSMFNGCTSLTSITCLATEYEDWHDGIINDLTGACSDWVDNVAASGTFTKVNGATWTSGTSGIPSGWTTQNVE